jgi:hypothetical protein
MATRMQQRRGTAEQWLLADPVLAAGEIGFETDTGSFKLGDGISHWGDLDYFETTFSLQGTLDDYVPLTQKGAALGVATLGADGFVPASQLDIDVSGDINAAVSALIGGAPELLDTLNELAAAIGDDANFVTTINSNITSGDAATLASAETYADLAEADAITTASADASAKASAAQSAAIAAAAIDATTKADAAEAAANIYTDGRETAITTAYQTYADNAETAAISSASTDATTKANAAETNSKSYTDSLIGDATVDGTSGNTVAARIDAAVSGLVDSAPGLLDTLNEIAAAIGDDPDFITSIGSTITAGDTATLTSANSYTDTRETAITTAYQTYADTAESDAVSAASADATTKANAAQAAAEATASADATTKANAAQAAAEATASADATTKANAAESSANAYTDGEISTLDTSLKAYADQTYVDADARNAVSAGDGLGYDSLTGVFSADLGFGLEIDVNGNISVDGSIISTDQDVANLIGDVTVNGTTGNTVTDRIASAVSGLVDSAPATLDTLNELAAALGDDANFATTVSTQIGGKADSVHTHAISDVTNLQTTLDGKALSSHTHLLADVTDVTATALELNVLDGITSTTAELNHTDGVTSNIQTQLNAKAATSHNHTTSDITDFEITSPADGSFLKYNSTTSKWEDAIIIDGGNA